MPNYASSTPRGATDSISSGYHRHAAESDDDHHYDDDGAIDYEYNPTSAAEERCPLRQFYEVMASANVTKVPVLETAVINAAGEPDGLFWSDNRDINFVPSWPVVDVETQQTKRLFSTRKESALLTRQKLLVSYFSNSSAVASAATLATPKKLTAQQQAQLNNSTTPLSTATDVPFSQKGGSSKKGRHNDQHPPVALHISVPDLHVYQTTNIAPTTVPADRPVPVATSSSAAVLGARKSSIVQRLKDRSAAHHHNAAADTTDGGGHTFGGGEDGDGDDVGPHTQRFHVRETRKDDAVEYVVRTLSLDAQKLNAAVMDQTLPEGLLLRYKAPANGHHNLVRIIFTPYITKVEKHQTVAAVTSTDAPLKERVSTNINALNSRNGRHLARVVPVSPQLSNTCDKLCDELYQALMRQGVLIRLAVYYCLELNEADGKLAFLWPGKLELRPASEADQKKAVRAFELSQQGLGEGTTPPPIRKHGLNRSSSKQRTQRRPSVADATTENSVRRSSTRRESVAAGGMPGDAVNASRGRSTSPHDARPHESSLARSGGQHRGVDSNSPPPPIPPVTVTPPPSPLLEGAQPVDDEEYLQLMLDNDVHSFGFYEQDDGAHTNAAGDDGRGDGASRLSSMDPRIRHAVREIVEVSAIPSHKSSKGNAGRRASKITLPSTLPSKKEKDPLSSPAAAAAALEAADADNGGGAAVVLNSDGVPHTDYEGFIRALCDPEEGKRYFQLDEDGKAPPSSAAEEEVGGRKEDAAVSSRRQSTAASLTQSNISRAHDDDDEIQLEEQHHAGAVVGDNGRSTTDSPPASTPPRPQRKVEIDPSIDITAKGYATPVWRQHSKRLMAMRRKYGGGSDAEHSKKVSAIVEEEAKRREEQKEEFRSFCTTHNGGGGKWGNGSRPSSAMASLRGTYTPSRQVDRSSANRPGSTASSTGIHTQPWHGASHIDYNTRTPFTPNTSQCRPLWNMEELIAAQGWKQGILRRHVQPIADGSLMHYLNGCEDIQRAEGAPMDDDDVYGDDNDHCASFWREDNNGSGNGDHTVTVLKKRRQKTANLSIDPRDIRPHKLESRVEMKGVHEPPRIPPAPVAEFTNTHQSISEDLVRANIGDVRRVMAENKAKRRGTDPLHNTTMNATHQNRSHHSHAGANSASASASSPIRRSVKYSLLMPSAGQTSVLEMLFGPYDYKMSKAHRATKAAREQAERDAEEARREAEMAILETACYDDEDEDDYMYGEEGHEEEGMYYDDEAEFFSEVGDDFGEADAAALGDAEDFTKNSFAYDGAQLPPVSSRRESRGVNRSPSPATAATNINSGLEGSMRRPPQHPPRALHGHRNSTSLRNSPTDPLATSGTTRQYPTQQQQRSGVTSPVADGLLAGGTGGSSPPLNGSSSVTNYSFGVADASSRNTYSSAPFSTSSRGTAAPPAPKFSKKWALAYCTRLQSAIEDMLYQERCALANEKSNGGGGGGGGSGMGSASHARRMQLHQQQRGGSLLLGHSSMNVGNTSAMDSADFAATLERDAQRGGNFTALLMSSPTHADFGSGGGAALLLHGSPNGSPNGTANGVAATAPANFMFIVVPTTFAADERRDLQALMRSIGFQRSSYEEALLCGYVGRGSMTAIGGGGYDDGSASAGGFLMGMGEGGGGGAGGKLLNTTATNNATTTATTAALLLSAQYENFPMKIPNSAVYVARASVCMRMFMQDLESLYARGDVARLARIRALCERENYCFVDAVLSCTKSLGTRKAGEGVSMFGAAE